MPAAVIPIGNHVRAEFVVLSLAPAGMPRIPFGILLLNSHSGELEWKFRPDLEDLPIPTEDIEYVSCLDEDFRSRVREAGGAEFLQTLENSLSGFLLISERETVAGRNATQILNRLFDRHIDTRVVEFKTHLPMYRLLAAATRFGQDSEVSDSEIEWVRAPRGLRLSEDLFVVRVVGRSMEPLIPDGSLVVFRKIAPGSRKGKRLLIEELGASDTSARFTVKRYTSLHNRVSEDEWSHGSIRLEPLNPEFPAFELDAEAFDGKYRVVGEFVQVLSEEDE